MDPFVQKNHNKLIMLNLLSSTCIILLIWIELFQYLILIYTKMRETNKMVEILF